MLRNRHLYNMKRQVPSDIDEYISGFPENIQASLQQIRSIISKAVPDAEEGISYAIPVFKLKGKALLYFAGFTSHISVYPAPRQQKEFKEELAAYKGGKGTMQIPADRKVPVSLIRRIAALRRDLILTNFPKKK
jgi:uncharacterized protein YdhG (YjbR/CyaY superfamily)